MNTYIVTHLAEFSLKCFPKQIIYQQVRDYLNFIHEMHFTCFSNVCDTLINWISANFPGLIIEKIVEPNINHRIISLLINVSHPHSYRRHILFSTIATATADFQHQTKTRLTAHPFSIFNSFLHIEITADW